MEHQGGLGSLIPTRALPWTHWRAYLAPQIPAEFYMPPMRERPLALYKLNLEHKNGVMTKCLEKNRDRHGMTISKTKVKAVSRVSSFNFLTLNILFRGQWCLFHFLLFIYKVIPKVSLVYFHGLCI